MNKLGIGVLLTAVLALFAVSPAAAQDSGSSATRINLINGIPGSSVDVVVDGMEVISGFEFRDTYDLSGLAGQSANNVVFTEAGTDTELLSVDSLDLPESGNISVLLHLKVDGSTTLSTFENDLSRIAAGDSRLVVRHLAAAPAVDVLAAGEAVFQGLGNGQERRADLPAGDVTATLVPSGEDGPIIIGPADLPLVEGDQLIVYGLGSVEEDTMTVLTEVISGLGSAPSAVNTGNSPVGEPSLTGGLTVAALVAVGIGTGFSVRRRWSMNS